MARLGRRIDTIGCAAAFFLLFFAACGVTEGKQKAEAAVDTFHRQLNGSRFGDIYSATTPAFKQAGPVADFETYMAAICRKLGAFKSTQLGAWRVNATSQGTFVLLQYNSQFEHDSAVEDFTFEMVDARPVLQAYNINSRTLVTK